jgi:hypothetical protein
MGGSEAAQSEIGVAKARGNVDSLWMNRGGGWHSGGPSGVACGAYGTLLGVAAGDGDAGDGDADAADRSMKK